MNGATKYFTIIYRTAYMHVCECERVFFQALLLDIHVCIYADECKQF